MHIERQSGLSGRLDHPGQASISDALVAEFGAFVTQAIGLHFPGERLPELARAMAAIARERDGAVSESSIRALMNHVPTRSEVELLAAHLTVGETYFFRDAALFEALERDILPPLIAARRHHGKYLRIWSAGCCTGEELYSIAILLDRMIPDFAEWHLTLLGTDIHPQFLRKATEGAYRDWSFRSVPDWIRRRYFQGTEQGDHVVSARLRSKTRFEHLNLVTDSYPRQDGENAAMDVILCRNVLMYFEPSIAERVTDGLHRCLAPGGWLAVSAAEAGGRPFRQFERVRFSDATLFRKCANVPAPVPVPMPESPAPVRVTTVVPDVRGATVVASRGVPSPESGENLTAPLLALQARRCADEGRLDEAERLCLAAIAADKCDPTVRYLHALVQAEQGRLDAATATLRQALYLDESFVLAHFTLGSLYRRCRMNAEADRHFASASRLLRTHAPDDVLAASDGLSAGHLLNAIRNEGGGA
jgi:chemotaxis protein methyltransferase CheR